jgi:hypothetical protein
MGWIIVAILCLFAFKGGLNADLVGDPPLAPAPTVEPAHHDNPGYQPCSKSTEGVKGRIRAVPVQPMEPC